MKWSKWNLPAGGLDDEESVIDGAIREIYEETGCKVEITGVLEIINEILNGINVVCFFFDTKIVEEKISVDGDEISNVKWFSYDEMINMKDELRADGYFLSTIQKKMENKIQSLDLVKVTNKK